MDQEDGNQRTRAAFPSAVLSRGQSPAPTQYCAIEYFFRRTIQRLQIIVKERKNLLETCHLIVFFLFVVAAAAAADDDDDTQ